MSKDIKELVMIGAGPSALAAAIYTAREDIETILYEKAVVGGLAAITDKVENYPGFPDGIEGMELANQLEKQAKRFGAQIKFGSVSSVSDKGDYRSLTIDGEEVKARAVLIATGSDNVKLNVPGEAEYYGRGVHYCATCDGAFYRDRSIAVVGGGNSAVQEAIFLTKFASHIDLLVRSTIKASEILQNDLKKLSDEGKITVHLGAAIDEIVATDNKVTGVKVTQGGKEKIVKIDGVFVFVGLKPNTAFLKDSDVELDDQGFIKTDNKLKTNLNGVYASGDVRSGATMQIASAVGEGATAALNIGEFLHSLNRD